MMWWHNKLEFPSFDASPPEILVKWVEHTDVS